MVEFRNLPGVVVHKEDGNLTVLESVPGNITLIIGTAPDGPVDQIYVVRDTSTAEAIYDPNSTKEGTLLRGIYEALQSGAPYVAGYRMGAAPAVLDFLNGYTIHTRNASETVADNYKIYYDYSSGEHTLKIYNKAGELEYDSTTGLDLGNLVVYFNERLCAEDATVTVGTTTVPVVMSEVEKAIKPAITLGAGISSLGFVVDGKVIKTTAACGLKAGQIVKVANAATTVTGFYMISYVDEKTASNSYATIYISHKLVNDVWVEFAGFVAASVASSPAIVAASGGPFATTEDFPETGAINTIYTATTTGLKYIWNPNGEPAQYEETGLEVADAGSATTIQLFAKCVPANTGLNMTYMEKYEALARAYWQLEAAVLDTVVPMGVYADAPNLVPNLVTFNSAGEVNNLTLPGVSDFLGQVYPFEHNGELFFIWKTNDSTGRITPTPYSVGLDGVHAQKLISGNFVIDTVLSETANPDADIAFGEANFAHQLAEYCYGLSVNENEASGVISMMPPTNFSKPAVTRWMGSLPTYDPVDGDITVSGTGVLGWRPRVGTTMVSPGFFHTSNGLIDGTVVVDHNNNLVDIGRHISIIAMPLVIRSGYTSTTSGYVAAASTIYAGLDMSLDVKEAPTAKRIRARVSLPFLLKKTYLNDLTGAGYVVFGTTVDGSVKVIDAPTAALPTSDYTRRLTVKLSSAVVEIIRALAEPFIGGIINGEIRNALEEQSNAALKRLQEPDLGYITAGVASVRATRDMEIKGEAIMRLSLYLPGEFRKLTIYMNLAK